MRNKPRKRKILHAGVGGPTLGKQCRNLQMNATHQALQPPILVKEKDGEVAVGIPAEWRGLIRSES